MIDPTYVVTMATYNRWQNASLFDAAGPLSDEDRRQDRGAFFGSIHGTLNHVLWADEVWLGRLAGRAHPATPIEKSRDRLQAWEQLRAARIELDADIVTWAGTIAPSWLAQFPAWSSAGRDATPPHTNAFFVVHMFNHQTHHRGQVHAMLTAAGATPGDTDLLKMAARAQDAR